MLHNFVNAIRKIRNANASTFDGYYTSLLCRGLADTLRADEARKDFEAASNNKIPAIWD